jgi:hypothetical protein
MQVLKRSDSGRGPPWSMYIPKKSLPQREQHIRGSRVKASSNKSQLKSRPHDGWQSFFPAQILVYNMWTSNGLVRSVPPENSLSCQRHGPLGVWYMTEWIRQRIYSIPLAVDMWLGDNVPRRNNPLVSVIILTKFI